MSNLGYGFCLTHPGELLKEEIGYRKLSQSSLAKQMGVPHTALKIYLTSGVHLQPTQQSCLKQRWELMPICLCVCN